MSKTITINVEEEVDAAFRKFAGAKYGKRKGYLGKALTQAMREWVKKQDKEVETLSIELLKTGIKMAKWKFNRGELHER